MGSLLLSACGGGAITHRNVDTVVGRTDAHGAPRNTHYTVRAETEREAIRLIVSEVSECDKLRMKIVQRVDETVKGGDVIAREPARQMQMADGKYGVVPCNERWARNVQVALRVGTQTYRLGMPSPKGEVVANLAGELRQSLYAESAPAEATVMVDDAQAGTISLAAYTSHEARIAVLLDELRALLAKDEPSFTKADIARSYELYFQLGQLDSGGDARVAALRTRFLELLFQRKAGEATENLKKNIKALNEAKNLLPGLVAGAVPGFVSSAVSGGIASAEAIWWARGEVATALRQVPSLCAGSPFTWSRLSSGDVGGATRLAFSYLRFAYDDPFQAEVRGLCGRLSQ